MCELNSKLVSQFALIMDPSFEKRLLEYGIGRAVLKVLQNQRIHSVRVFRAMKEEHIVGLLKCDGMPIGSHALLWEMWEEYSTCPPVRSFGMFGIWVIVCTCVCVCYFQRRWLCLHRAHAHHFLLHHPPLL